MSITGHGVTCNIIVTGSSTAVADVLDIDMPEFEKFLADATDHSVTGGFAKYIDTGLKAINPFKMTLGWDATGASHIKILAAFNRTSGVAFQIASPNSNETIYFDAFVQKVGRVAKHKDAYKADITIQPSGAPTIS